MTDAFALDPSYGQPDLGGTPFRRFLKAASRWRQGFAAELSQARQEHAIRRGLRRLDRRLMRDLGLDRGAC